MSWLMLLYPNLGVAQGPLCQCDTRPPKLNPPLFHPVSDVIAHPTHRAPVLFSFPAIKSCVRAGIIGGPRNSFGAFGVSAGIHQRGPPAEAVTIKVWMLQAELNLQQPRASLPITLHDTKLTVVRTNYMTQWVERGCHSVPLLCQINTSLMTLLPPCFSA